MNGLGSFPGVETPPNSLPVNSIGLLVRDFPANVPFYRPHPCHKTGGDGLALEPGEDPPIHAMFQGEELFQPGFFGFPVFFDVFPPFCESHDGQQGDKDNFN
jgi:hypothetical protein